MIDKQAHFPAGECGLPLAENLALPRPMKSLLCFLSLLIAAQATVIDVVIIHQPLSLHGSDVDDEVDDTGESLQAGILSRPMALTGGFPEVLVEAIAMPHQLPTNNPNYAIKEVNLVVLCGLKLSAEIDDTGVLQVEINVANLQIPDDVDLTARQVLKLAIGSIRKTVMEYNAQQKDDLKVLLRIVGTNESNRSLEDLGCQYKAPGKGA
jgi:hypothetical protein